MTISINNSQFEKIERARLIAKLAGNLRSAFPNLPNEIDKDVEAFIEACIHRANIIGLNSEIGIGAYAINSCYLGFGYENKNPHLLALLKSKCSEIRKVYAMNAWVESMMSDDSDQATEVLKNSFIESAYLEKV